MLLRQLQKNIVSSLQTFPVCGIIGSRQVGKSTLAKMLCDSLTQNSIYLDLERDSDLRKLEEPELYLAQFKEQLIVIDEIQRKPDLFPLIRSLVDEWNRNGCFLILGSASPALLQQSSESLAGRIIYHELSPFLYQEISREMSDTLWLRGGYPRSFLAESADASFTWRWAFLRTVLERDIPQLGKRIPSTTLQRFLEMTAHLHGNEWNASKISKSLGVSPPSTRMYIDLFVDTFFVNLLPPYFVNIKKRLVKSPKIYFRDTGILHCLLGIITYDQLLGHPSRGESWEGFVIEQLINVHSNLKGEFYFYRTFSGAEIDLVFLPFGQKPIAIEIKLSLSPKLQRGFYQAYEDIGCQKGYVIYSGEEKYPMGKDIWAIPLSRINEVFS